MRLRNIFFPIGVLFCALMLFECAARLCLPSWAPPSTEHEAFWQYDSLLGWSQKPGAGGIFRRNEFSAGISINADGLRDTIHPINKIPGRRRMMILGDSYGWGYGVGQDKIFHQIFQRQHPEWEVINASVSGYSTDQEYLYYTSRGYRYHPDVVVCLIAGNDFEGNRTSGYAWYSKPYFEAAGDSLILRNMPVPSSSLLQKFNRMIIGKTYVFSKILQFILPAFRELRRQPDNFRENDSTGILPPPTGPILRNLKHAVTANGGQFLLITVPMDSVGSRQVRRFSENDSIPLLQLDKIMAGHPEFYIPRDEHWSAAGHQTVSRAMESFLDSLRMIK
jgi:hypothetical protein